MTPAEADACADLAGAYVHIPFCSSVCPYCDFAVVEGQDHLVDGYVRRVCEEIESGESWRPLDAAYFGGGTPSHIETSALTSILETLESKHGLGPNAEISVEANPEDFSIERAHELALSGFNRVSFGAQSLDAGVLLSLGRRHHSAEVASSVANARAAGIQNLSIDLIYGTPGETDKSWEDTLDGIIDLEPDHVSCYALTVELGTPLGKAVNDGAAGPDPDIQADRYELAGRKLADAGYQRYEVSNWSKPGKECRYNAIVWAQGEYEAYGNGAHGFRGGRRFRNIRRLDAYLDRDRNPRAGEDQISGWDREIDRLFVGLRRTAGVARGPGVDALTRSLWGRRLMDAGVLNRTDDRLLISRPLMTDEVHRAVLDLAPPEGWAKQAGADNVRAR